MKRILILTFLLSCFISNTSYAFQVNCEGFSFYTYDTDNIESINYAFSSEAMVSYKNVDFATYEVADLGQEKTLSLYHLPKEQENNSEQFLLKWLFLYKNMYPYDFSTKLMPAKIIDSEILPSKNGIIIISENITNNKKNKRTTGIGLFILGDKLYSVSFVSSSDATYVKKVTENIMNTIYPAR